MQNMQNLTGTAKKEEDEVRRKKIHTGFSLTQSSTLEYMPTDGSAF